MSTYWKACVLSLSFLVAFVTLTTVYEYQSFSLPTNLSAGLCESKDDATMEMADASQQNPSLDATKDEAESPVLSIVSNEDIIQQNRSALVSYGDSIYVRGDWDGAPIVLESHKLIFFSSAKVGCTGESVFHKCLAPFNIDPCSLARSVEATVSTHDGRTRLGR